jgi:hypothetical protein
MAIIDTTINRHIEAQLISENEARESAHSPSGKLSASILYQPLRFQVLKSIGAPRKPFDAYTLAKFKRGRDVEDWYVEQTKQAGVAVTDKDAIEALNLKFFEDGQPFGEYKGAIGYIDNILNTDLMQAKKGIIPNEIKSITNMKMKNIARQGIDYHYRLQACFYAMAMGLKWYGVTVVSAEDLRSETHIFNVIDLKQDVETAISRFDEAMKDWRENKKLPPFEPNPNVPWTANLQYAMFEEFWAQAPDDKVVAALTEMGL